MADKVPDLKYQLPSERRYVDDSKSVLGTETIFDPAKTGKDYGVEDPKVFKKAESGALGGG